LKSLTLNRFALGLCVAVVMLAGCGALPLSPSKGQGDMQPPIAAPGATQLSRTHRASGSYGSLLYASGNNEVAILTYPGGETVGNITGVLPAGICTDASNGNVWIVTQYYKGFYAYEFSHGGTTQNGEVKVPESLMALECAVDPSTHNLAITNWIYGDGRPYIDVWPGGTGNPSAYSPPFSPQSIVYDNEGNLFTTGSTESNSFRFAELPKGGSTFTNIELDRPAVWPGGLAWDGKYLAVGYSDPGSGRKFERIYRVRIKGSRGRVVSTQEFNELPKRSSFWLQGDTIIAAPEKGSKGDAFWRYPQGGKPYKTGVGSFNAYYVAVSVAPSGSHNRK
jgi:hypothetical protein